MKSLCLLALLGLLVCPAKAQPFYGPLYAPGNVSLAGIGTTAAGTTTTVTNQVMDIRGFQNVTLQTVFQFSGPTTSNVVYTFSRSLDSLSWETQPVMSWTVQGNGTNLTVATTNLLVGGSGYLKLLSIQNTAPDRVLTNKSFGYSIKRGAY